jgi:hypothetical protein
VFAAILEREPAPLESARPLERVIRRSLAKDPEQRFQTARDLKASLLWAMEQAAEPATKVQRRAALIAWALAVVAAVALMGWFRASSGAHPAPQQLVRLDVDLGPEVTLGSGGSNVILSPDGSRLVYNFSIAAFHAPS